MAIPPPPPEEALYGKGIPPPPPEESLFGGMMGMAKQAIGETLSEDLPLGVGKAVGAIRQDIPNYLAEKGGLPGAVLGTAIGTAGEMLPKTGGDLALQGATGPLSVAAGLASKHLLVPAGKWAIPKLTSALTRIEEPIVQRAIERSAQVGKKMKSVLTSDMTEQIVGRMKDAMKDVKGTVGKWFGSIEDAVAAKSTAAIPIADIGDKLGTDLAKTGFKVKGFQAGDVTRNANAKTLEILKDLQKPQLSFRDTLNLRRKIDDVVEFGKRGSLEVGTVEDKLLKDAREVLNERLLGADKDFARANNAYKKMIDTYNILKDDIFSGKDEVVAGRIARIFKKGSAERRMIERMDMLGQNTADELGNMLDTITAQKFQNNINPAIGKAVFSTGGGLAGFGAKLAGVSNPAALATAAVGLGTAMAATSPKLNFRVIQASQQIARILKSLGLSPKSRLAASLSAPAIHDAIVDHSMDEHLGSGK